MPNDVPRTPSTAPRPASRIRGSSPARPADRARDAAGAIEAPSASPPHAQHVLHRALDYAALERAGLTAAQIARRRRRSKGYVSIALRLGRALAACAPEELEILRSPRVTWKLVQRLVRSSTDDRTIVRQLVSAAGGFSSLTVDRRRGRRRRRVESGESRGPERAGTLSWSCDAEWARRDPEGYVAAYRRFLLRLQREFGAHLRASLSYPGIQPERVPLVGQSIRRLAASARQPSTLQGTRASGPSEAAPNDPTIGISAGGGVSTGTRPGAPPDPAERMAAGGAGGTGDGGRGGRARQAGETSGGAAPVGAAAAAPIAHGAGGLPEAPAVRRALTELAELEGLLRALGRPGPIASGEGDEAR